MKRFILITALAVFTITAIPSCVCKNEDLKPPDSGKEAKKFINVNIITRDLDPPGKTPEIDPRWVVLEYGKSQQVRWIIDDSALTFTITFKRDENPFENGNINHEKNKSGQIKEDPGEKDKAYWYSVDVEGFETLDPGIIIWKKN